MIKPLYARLRASGTNQYTGVLAPDEPDSRDLLVGVFGWGKHTPKHTSKLIPTFSIKNQSGRNTCTFESSVVQHEIHEGQALEVRSVVAYAKTQGFIKQNGFSSLKLSQKALRDFGCLEEGEVRGRFNSWRGYSNLPVLGEERRTLAGRHKTKSYWKVETMSEIYKAIDKGETVQTAMRWYTGYNMSGGFRSPFLLDRGKGSYVGAHAITIVGYDRDYLGFDVIIFQNSYGAKWGDEGKFYMLVDDFKKELDVYGGYMNMDIPVDTGKLLRDFTGWAVKAKTSSKIFLIENGLKRHFVSMEAMLKRGFKSHKSVTQDMLDAIPEGKQII